NGFAHNDYCHKHPLYDALDNGFTNIEADIFLKNNKLIVAHVFPYFKSKRTLEALYLKPLSERIADYNGKVYANYNKPVILMIDIKTSAGNTYEALKPLLEKYSSMLTRLEDGKIVYGAVTVVLSGHKPYDMIGNEQNRLAFIDEDLRKVSRDSTMSNMFTMASCKYSKMLRWDGKGIFPVAERNRLCAFVALAHSMGEKVRLWASPERKVVWDELLKCGVDLINTDKLATLRKYLNSNSVTLAKAD
ncbi:MAG TPA: phosphatidylinositol-specific phospholipase C/glycerophosphodiester phosphodiesterase family protein, partial [Mucilaginibacter sp.]|nr:phosphatidylinositol-specific phospholipase C/glycerophosphodiester phosphodiesterase family protein [Mucilaginibacter sp.]